MIRMMMTTTCALALVGCPSAAGPDAGPADAGRHDAGQDDAGQDDAGQVSYSEPLTLTASDGTTLAARIHRPANPDGRGVVLVHQFNADQTQWAPWVDDLRDRGFTVLTFDLRGHGDSDPYTGTNFLQDPAGAPLDVHAAVQALAADDAVTAPGIALMGASVGANLAVASRLLGWTTHVVALSPRRVRVEDLAAQAFATTSGVFYASGELEPGEQAADCQAMYDDTTDPRGLYIAAGSTAHGVQLLIDDPAFATAAIDWLDAPAL